MIIPESGLYLSNMRQYTLHFAYNTKQTDCMGFKRPEVQILSPRPYETLEIIEVSRVLLYISPAPGEGSGELIAMRKTANPFPVRREARSQDPTQRSQAAGLQRLEAAYTAAIQSARTLPLYVFVKPTGLAAGHDLPFFII